MFSQRNERLALDRTENPGQEFRMHREKPFASHGWFTCSQSFHHPLERESIHTQSPSTFLYN